MLKVIFTFTLPVSGTLAEIRMAIDIQVERWTDDNFIKAVGEKIAKGMGGYYKAHTREE